MKLTPELDIALSREAKRMRKSKATLVLDALVQYLQGVDAELHPISDGRGHGSRRPSTAAADDAYAAGRNDLSPDDR